MTMEAIQSRSSGTGKDASPEPKTSPHTSTQHFTQTSTNNTQLSFDPMTSSLAKRRYSQTQRSTSATTSGSEESKCGKQAQLSKAEQCTKARDAEREDNVGDVRKTLISKKETKFFANLPDANDARMSPDEYLHKLVFATCGMHLEPKKAKTLNDYFAEVTDDQIAAYTMTVVSACRSNDLDALKKLHSEEGQTMNCFNRFGESLLTMACRRGFEAIVEFLLEQSDVDVRISDDSGRTVMHDACWNPSPQLKICQWIMARDPSLFFIADNRGCTPFEYARPEHWGTWRQFLLDNKDSLQALRADDVKSKLSKQQQ